MALRDRQFPQSCARSLLLLALGLGGAGCSSRPVVVQQKQDPAQENLMHIGNAYRLYITRNNRPPNSAQDIAPLLKEHGDPQTLLRSPGDGQPFVICFGLDLLGRQEWARSTPVVAYEQKGTGGKRYVLTLMGSVEQLTDAEFRQASFPPGHRPPL